MGPLAVEISSVGRATSPLQSLRVAWIRTGPLEVFGPLRTQPGPVLPNPQGLSQNAAGAGPSKPSGSLNSLGPGPIRQTVRVDSPCDSLVDFPGSLGHIGPGPDRTSVHGVPGHRAGHLPGRSDKGVKWPRPSPPFRPGGNGPRGFGRGPLYRARTAPRRCRLRPLGPGFPALARSYSAWLLGSAIGVWCSNVYGV